jgi:hypothetical protein
LVGLGLWHVRHFAGVAVSSSGKLRLFLDYADQ